MDSQKSLVWPVALLAAVMVIGISIGTLGLSYFVWVAAAFMVLLFVIIVLLQAREEKHVHVATG
ncbi:MAG: hypothetical protein KGH60_01415 [Candidatus Micrarchaeota archaeon]|nr:hypothetical protein [Candidatus Micrarchaeota archaeon]